MKIVILLCISIMPVLSFSQKSDCGVNIKNDEITKETNIKTEIIDLGEISYFITAGTRKSIFPKLFFGLNKAECIDNWDKIYILFENDERIEANNILDFNCDGVSMFILGRNKYKKLLSENIIKAIRIDTDKSYKEAYLSTEQAVEFKNLIHCVYDRKWENEIKYK